MIRSVRFLVLWYLTPLSTIIQLYCGGQFYWKRKPPTCRKLLINSIYRTRDEHANNYTTDRMVVEIYRPMQSVFITARVVSSVPVPEEVCSSQHSKI
jgi:hypothetical protein